MWDVVGPSACRMKLRLPSQQKVICVRKEATVAQLVEYVKHTEKELQGKEIELLTGGKPPENLASKVGVERRDEM